MDKAVSSKNWTTVIKPQSKYFNFNLKELFHYKDLIFLFVRRDFVALYKQTILGPLWYLLEPLFTTVVFTIIFGNIANLSTDGVPDMLFYLCGIVLWNFFTNCLTKTSSTFLTNSSVFGKVYFPRLTMPISIIISNFIAFSIQLILFFGFFAYFIIIGSSVKPSIWLLIFPLVILQTALLGFGLGVLVTSLTTKYRDLNFLVTFGVRLWMYATPIAYPMSQLPEKWRVLIYLNPMSPIVETFRYIFLGAGQLSFFWLGISALTTLVILVLGINIFSKTERTFMDRI